MWRAPIRPAGPRRLTCILVLLLLWPAGIVGALAQSPALPPDGGLAGQLFRDADGQIRVRPAAPSAAARTEAGETRERAARPATAAPRPVRAESPAAGAVPPCGPQALACLGVIWPDGRSDVALPLTFGHPLRAGRLRPQQTIVARLNGGAPVPVQIDNVATHRDGSVRHAVFTLLLPRPDRAGVASLGLEIGAAPAAAPRLAPPVGAATAIRVELDAWSPQIVELLFGNRADGKNARPFAIGDRVSIQLGADPADRFVLTVTEKTAGAGLRTLTALAEEASGLINRSRRFTAYRVHPAYERVWVRLRDLPGQAFEAEVRSSGAAPVRVTTLQRFEPPRRLVASTSAMAPARALGGSHLWLNGPLAEEAVFVAPLRAADGAEEPELALRFHIRRHAGSGSVRAEVVLENTWAENANPRNRFYDLAIHVDGAKRLEQRAVEHFLHSRWRRAFWTGGHAEPALMHDRAELVASAAVPPYDLSLRIAEATIAGEGRILAAHRANVTSSGAIAPYMPTTGGRADIGPLPRWSAVHVVSQDVRARDAVLANGEAAAVVPIHYRERRSDLPLSIAAHPQAWTPRPRSVGDERYPATAYRDTPFHVDQSHQPSLSYYPYLLTGDLFHLEELHFWANWNALSVQPGYREGASGLVKTNQVRGQAWALRTLGHAALVTPDRHPLKAYFGRQLAANMDWYVANYPRNPERSSRRVGRWLPAGFGNRTTIAPWQNDYMAIVLADLVRNEVAGAREFLEWLAGFVVGRWRAEEHGFCRAFAPAYWLKIRAPDSDRDIDDWGELARLNHPSIRNCSEVALPESNLECPGCYPAVGRAALATIATVGLDSAMIPYQFISALILRHKVKYFTDPTFAFTVIY